MATSLQQQLAAISAKSTQQLDLRAQKARHSKSLLFEPKDAASQSFDTLFQLCYEGFEELCMLDTRFSPFARNLFSEQSKDEDRTQMTARENEELDNVVETFLGLVGGRLLLKPAMKAVEWLVRRFRVQEYNTENVLLTFLPYHTSHIFPTLLSILPDKLPASFRFLHPYVASLQSPPRHAVLSAAINSTAFFSALSQYVLRVAKARNHSAILLGFWASITAQAVNGIIDSTRSGRDAIRKQREEDLLLRVLPILQSALSIQAVPELYLGSCMIMTILVTKASLEEKVINAMMEAVASAWGKATVEDGMTCLAVMAEEKQSISQPAAITRAILKDESSATTLDRLSKRYRVDKLVLATCIGTTDSSLVKHSLDGSAFVRSVLDQELLAESPLEHLVDATIVKAKKAIAGVQDLTPFVKLLACVADKPEHARLVQQSARQHNVDLRRLSADLALTLAASELAPQPEPQTMEIDDIPQSQAELSPSFDSLPNLDSKSQSFLDPTNDGAFDQWATVFRGVVGSPANIQLLLDQKTLRRSSIATVPTYLTFLARVWTGNVSVSSKAQALDAATNDLKDLGKTATLDLQVLVPYLLVALSDKSQRIRRSAAQMCIIVLDLYGALGKDKVAKNLPLWCAESVYGVQGSASLLPSQDAYKFLSTAVTPALEDCILDGEIIGRVLADSLNAAHDARPGSAGPDRKEMKAALRSEICNVLANHIAQTPVLQVKLTLLTILARVGKAANTARKNTIMPFVETWNSLTGTALEAACKAENTDCRDLEAAVLSNLTHRNADEIQMLKSIAAGRSIARSTLPAFAFERLRRLWPAMKAPSQSALADFLLNLVTKSIAEGGETNMSDDIQAEALETLRNLPYSTDVLVHLVDSIPSATELQEQDEPPTKKRRTSQAELSRPKSAHPEKLKNAVQRITRVLEVVESSKPQQHPQLLKGLFHLLGELHHFKVLAGSQLVYLQGLLMSCLLAVVEGLKGSSHADIDRSVIRADLIVECVRTTSSTQVHNTALLLISVLATWAPELVLHSVMPLFTFMSTTLLRQSDEFSAHVTDQTVARIVPPLAASLKKAGKDIVSGAAELLLSFTAAFEHIPLHRRAGLFQHLVQTLGPGEALFAVAAMLVERYPSDAKTAPFVSELMGMFDVSVQLSTAKRYLQLVVDARKPKHGLADTILGFGEKDAAQRAASVIDLLRGLSELLDSSRLRRRIAKDLFDDASAQSVQNVYAQILEQTMQLTRDASSDSSLKGAADAVLASLLALTPTKDFIESSAQLMQTGSHETRQQVFRSLEARVAQAKRGDATLQHVFMDVLPNCCVFISNSQPVATRYAAITCVDQIVERYGKKDRAAVLRAAEVVAGDAALGSTEDSLRIIAILCLASAVEVLGDDFIEILPGVLSRILGYVEEALSKPAFNEHKMHIAAFTFATAVLDHLPWMFSAQFLDRTLNVAAKSAAHEDTNKSDALSIAQFHDLAARKISAQELFGSVDRTWPSVLTFGSAALEMQLAFFHQAIKFHTKATITKNAPTLFTILLNAFDLRRTAGGLPTDQTSQLCDAVDKVALDTTLKLNDATFRPFFVRLVEWATTTLPKKDGQGRTLRALSLYSFSHTLFAQLKSVVTSYASFLLDSAADLLTTLSHKDASQAVLLVAVLQTLDQSFQNDGDDFWASPAHFDAIATPVLTQLESAPFVSVTDHVIPSITSLASAAASTEHHKSMNTTIMQYMRHPHAAVRLAAVKCERAITKELNFDWLGLLPEMLPFISELQEDDDEAVERETLLWVRQIEEVSGESLEGMLQ